MKKWTKLVLLTGSILVLLMAFDQKQSVEIRQDWKKYYDNYRVKGAFTVFDSKNNKLIHYNKEEYTKPYLPASTYKIMCSMVALETGVIKNTSEVLKWDSVVRNPQWNYDQDMKTAFKNSTVWFYQELARRIGEEKMQYWVNKADYGNKNISGGIDKFWLMGDMRITQEQQIAFLRKIHDNKLPFSARTVQSLKQIMIADSTSEYVIRAKTGWSGNDKQDMGWYVGYVETKDNVYYFANQVFSDDLSNKDFPASRIEISYRILEELKIIAAKKK